MEKEIGIDKFLRESNAKYSAVIGELGGQAISDAGVTLVKRAAE